MSKKIWISGIIILLICVIGFLIISNNSTETNDDKNIISWQEAIEILHNGDVKEIFQTHSLDVTLKLNNGEYMHTKEPNIDEVFDEIEKCGDICKNIILGTE